jgi:GAF domain-containing protein
MELWKDLASLAAAAGPDGGLAVAKTLRALLVDQVPSDRAEIVVEGPQGFDRKSLTEHPAPLSDHDLLTAVSSARTPLRIDELSELAVYPKTLERVRALGMRSLLALPLSAAGGAKGVVVLLRDYPFAFAGVPLYRIEPMMAMAGIAMTQALALTAAKAASALGADREALERENAELLALLDERTDATPRTLPEPPRPETGALEARAERAESEQARLESEATALREEVERLRAELSAAAASLAAAEAAERNRRRRHRKIELPEPPPPDGEPHP